MKQPENKASYKNDYSQATHKQTFEGTESFCRRGQYLDLESKQNFFHRLWTLKQMHRSTDPVAAADSQYPQCFTQDASLEGT